VLPCRPDQRRRRTSFGEAPPALAASRPLRCAGPRAATRSLRATVAPRLPPARVARASREPHAHPRRVTPVAVRGLRASRFGRAQRSRHGSRPREWGSGSREPPPALAASPPLLATCCGSRSSVAGNRGDAAPARASGECVAIGTIPSRAGSRPLLPTSCGLRSCGAGNRRDPAPARASGTCAARATLPPSPRHVRCMRDVALSRAARPQRPRRGSRPRE